MYNLKENISSLKGVGVKTLASFNEAKIYTIKDLLLTPPKHYNIFEIHEPSQAYDNQSFVVEGYISSQIILRKIRNSIDNIIFYFQTRTQKIKVLAYGRGYLRFSLKKGMYLKIYGTYKASENSFSLNEIVTDNLRMVEPVYGIKGVTDNAITKLLKGIFLDIPTFKETIPIELLEKYRLLGINQFLKTLHFPNDANDVREVIRRKKYVTYFNYAIQMEALTLLVKNNTKEPKACPNDKIEKFISSLPYELTISQNEAIKQIVEDSKKNYVMNRLVQGDVGSGKTLVAMVAILLNIINEYQAILMAPTEILAQQHFETIKKTLKNYPVRVAILTSQTNNFRKEEIIKGLENGRINVLVTTQAVLYYKINYNRLGLLIIDEQHRFGVNDRQKLLSEYPHTDALYLSATPIPRTLGLVKFADMDISSMKEKPLNRKKIVTKVFSISSMQPVYRDIEQRIKRGEQVFCVGALIDGDTYWDLKTIKENIEANVSNANIQIIHGTMPSSQKQQIMQEFIDKKYNILVSTTVIEVGIDVKNATGIYIFNAERFGMSTLHQLRGRVGRNYKAAFCALITQDVKNERLKALEQTDDCFLLAEYDLKLRGPGEFLGEAQSGFATLDFESDLNFYTSAFKDAREYLLDYENGKNVTPHVLRLIETMLVKKTKLN